jgi:hypothetical protein
VASLLGGGAKTASTTPTQAMGIQFNSSQYGPPVPVVYGTTKVGGSCIWYGNFKSTAQSQSVGKGGGGSTTTGYTYAASFQMALCEGPIAGIGTVYSGTSTVSLSSVGAVVATGAAGQTPWSGLPTAFQLSYPKTAIISVANLNLGSSASLPDWNPEVQGLHIFPGTQDANPSDILTDICTDPNHGINFPWLGNLTQYSDYCLAMGLLLSPCYDQEQTAQQTLEDLFTYTNSAAWFSEGVLKVQPYGDIAATGNGVTYTPNVTPLYNLGEADFIVSPGDAPVTVTRKAPATCMNMVRVEFTDRANSYHTGVVVATIDQDVIANGARADDTEEVDICASASVARLIAQNLVQQEFYIRNTYEFKLGWRYCMLEPMDIVTLTDANTGLNEFPVRITEVAEDESGVLSITAEEFPEGVGHSATYNTQPNNGGSIDPNSDPGAVNPPYLFRGPGFLVSNNTPEIWCAVNGAGAQWGAADVYLSHDGTSYTYVGTTAQPARYGALATALPASGSDPDTTNTPQVQLYQSAQLLGGSQADADNLVTLAMVDNEIHSYETATLVGTSTYQLGYLRRGAYGSSNVTHVVGAPWVRLDDAIFRIPVDPSQIGSTVYVKFLSVNVFGRTPRTLSEETAYTYVVGTNAELPDVPPTPASFAVLPVADGVNITWNNSNPAAVGCTSIYYSTSSSGPFTLLAQVGPTADSYHHSFTTGATYYYEARSRGPLVSSGWSAYTSVVSSAGKTVANGADVTATQLAAYVLNPYFINGAANWTSPDSTMTWAAQSGSSGPYGAPYYMTHGGPGNSTVTAIMESTAYAPIYPGQTFKATCQINPISSPNGAACVRISWRNSSNSEIGAVTGSFITASTGEGTSIAVGQAPAGTVVLVVQLCASNHTSEYYCYSNVQFNYQPNSMDEVPDGSTRFGAIYLPAVQAGMLLPGSNLVFNPNFQLQMNDWTLSSNTALNWGQYAGLAAPCALFNPTSTATTAICLSTPIVGVTSGAAVSASLRVYLNQTLTGGDFSADVQFYTTLGVFISGSARICTLTANNGTQVTYQLPNIIAPGGAGIARIRFYTENATSVNAAIFVDHVKLELGSTCTPFNDAATQHGNLLTVSGSNQQIGDQRNLPAVTFSNYGSGWIGLSLSYTSTTTSATITASAATLQAGSVGISYNASSVSVTGSAGSSATYYLYYIDPNHAGGSLTLFATTSQITSLSNNAAVLLGTASVSFPTSGSGGGSGGGACVAVTAWVKRRRSSKIERVRASTVRVGDELLIMSPTTGAKRWGRVSYSQRKRSACVRVVTEAGISLTCSTTAPLGCTDGCTVHAPHLLGRNAAVHDQGVYGPERVTDVLDVGERDVQHITCEDDFFLTGDEPGRYLAHHNLKPP